MEFYKAAFGVEELFRVPGGGVGRFSIGSSEFWVSEESPPHQNFSPESLGGATARLLLVVPDPDAVYARALKAGAKAVSPVHDEHGWRFGRVVDPLGNRAGVVGAIRGEQSAGLSPRSFPLVAGSALRLAALLSPLTGLGFVFVDIPRANALGYFLSPPRGLEGGTAPQGL